MFKLGANSGRTIRIHNSRLSIPRSENRHRVDIAGKLILLPRKTITIDCVIVDLSTNGAKVKLRDEQQLPVQVLLFESYKQNIYECRVKWQDQQKAGLSFVDVYAKSARRALIEDCSLGLIEDEQSSQKPAQSPTVLPGDEEQ